MKTSEWKSHCDVKTQDVDNKEKQPYMAGIYARLSVDNGNIKNESIESQLAIAKDFLKGHSDMALYDCYTDLGKSGTNFRRKGFQRLLEDIRRQKVNCVIVKDFSRLGRDYIETGNYIEKIFPGMGVRFLSITDGYDSFWECGDNDRLGMNLKNLINDIYAKDIGMRVKAAKAMRREQGSYTGGITPYGLTVSYEDGKRILTKEPQTGAVIQIIYQMYENGSSISDIILYLYQNKIHRPSDYRALGQLHQKAGEKLEKWSAGTIKAILKNPFYEGILIEKKAIDDQSGN